MASKLIFGQHQRRPKQQLAFEETVEKKIREYLSRHHGSRPVVKIVREVALLMNRKLQTNVTSTPDGLAVVVATLGHPSFASSYTHFDLDECYEKAVYMLLEKIKRWFKITPTAYKPPRGPGFVRNKNADTSKVAKSVSETNDSILHGCRKGTGNLDDVRCQEKPVERKQIDDNNNQLLGRWLMTIVFHLYIFYYFFWTLSFCSDSYTIIFDLFILIISRVGTIAEKCDKLWPYRLYETTWPVEFYMMLKSAYVDSSEEQNNAIKPVSKNYKSAISSSIEWLTKLRPNFTDDKKVQKLDRVYDPFMYYLLYFALTVLTPVLLRRESFVAACTMTVLLLMVVDFNAPILITNICHLWGFHQYDSSMTPRKNLIKATIILGKELNTFVTTKALNAFAASQNS